MNPNDIDKGEAGARILEQVSQQLAPAFRRDATPHFVVALSGGLDSMVLLHVMARLRERLSFTLAALHVHHGLHPDADCWMEVCRHHCLTLNIPFQAERADVSVEVGSLEMKARSARYAIFTRMLAPGDWLLQAHHQNDQAETILFRLVRGQGVSGLAGIPQQRSLAEAEILRPLLAIGRDELAAVGQQWRLSWVDDPSNENLAHDRNYLRHVILPQLSERFPAVISRIAQSGEWLRETLSILEDWETALLTPRMTHLRGQSCLELEGLLDLGDSAQRNLLKAWLFRCGQTPGETLLIEAWRQCFKQGGESAPALSLQTVTLRRYRERLYLIPDGHFSDPSWAQSWPQSGWVWDGKAPFTLPDGRRITLPSGLVDVEGPFHLRRRQGGERLEAPGDSHRRELKTVFQQWAIPPWERESVPLLFQQDRLIALILDYS